MSSVRWFGADWGAPICSDTEPVETPAGRACFWCDEAIVEGDSGVTIPHVTCRGVTDEPYHLDCHVRQLLGGLNHLRGRCTCCGGTEPPDPPGLSVREAASAAVAYATSRPKIVVYHS